MDQVKELLEKVYGVRLPNIRLNNTDKMTNVELTQTQVEWVKKRYFEDYEVYGRWFET